MRRSDFGRYELHELLRQYAAEQLRRVTRRGADARERHARHYAAMLLERQAALIGPELAVARDELRGELDNLRAAAEWIVAEDDEHEALRGARRPSTTFLWMHSWFDGAETFERLARTAGFDADDPGKRERRRAGGGDVPGRHRRPTRVRPGSARSSPRAACPSCGRGTWSESSQRCLLALGIKACYRDVYPEAVAFSRGGRRRSRERSATGSPRVAAL